MIKLKKLEVKTYMLSTMEEYVLPNDYAKEAEKEIIKHLIYVSALAHLKEQNELNEDSFNKIKRHFKLSNSNKDTYMRVFDNGLSIRVSKEESEYYDAIDEAIEDHRKAFKEYEHLRDAYKDFANVLNKKSSLEEFVNMHLSKDSLLSIVHAQKQYKNKLEIFDKLYSLTKSIDKVEHQERLIKFIGEDGKPNLLTVVTPLETLKAQTVICCQEPDSIALDIMVYPAQHIILVFDMIPESRTIKHIGIILNKFVNRYNFVSVKGKPINDEENKITDN